jgi:integrase
MLPLCIQCVSNSVPKLSERRIRELKPTGGKDQWYNDSNGLYLRVRASGSKAFAYRYKRKYQAHIETLGTWPAMTLEHARRIVQQRRRQVVDPGSRTLREGIDRYIENVVLRDHKRPDTYTRYLERDLNPLHPEQLKNITRAHIADVLGNKAKVGPVAANRLLGVTKQLFRYLVEIGWLDSSPAELLSRRSAGGDEQSRERILTDAEIERLWKACDSTSHGPLLRWLLTTGQRISEGQAARHSDIRGGRWYIPENKSSRPHWLPVSTLMQEILDATPSGEYLFAQRSLTATQAWLKRWCKREKIDPAFTPHDLRRTFSTRLHKLGVQPYVVEKMLNHRLEGVMAVYNQHDYAEERLAALELWAVELRRLTAPTS